jgi:hypothetical protein
MCNYLERLYSDFVNPTVFNFWTVMKNANLTEIARMGVPLIVTGDGQGSVQQLLERLF